MALRIGLASAGALVLGASCHLVGGLDDYSFEGVGGGGAASSSGSAGHTNGGGGTGGGGTGGTGGATAASCGDGSVDVGEVCYGGTPADRGAGVTWVRDMVIVDCDGDGSSDVVVVGRLSQEVSANNELGALANDGNGTLGSAQVMGAQAFELGGMTAFDWDGVGELDLVIGINRSTAEAMMAYQNTGDCTYAWAETVFTGRHIYDLAPITLDADGKDDFLATVGGSPSDLAYLSSETGMTTQMAAASADEPLALATATMDADTRMDAVYVDAANDKVFVTAQDTNGFVAPAAFPTAGTTGARPVDLALGDLDDDAHIDVVTADFDGNSVTSLLNNGGGVLSLGEVTSVAGATAVTGAAPIAVALGDVDADGDLDAVTANEGTGSGASLTLLLNDGAGVFAVADSAAFPGVERSFPIALDYRPVRVALADMNADGALDIVWVEVNDTLGGANVMVLLADP